MILTALKIETGKSFETSITIYIVKQHLARNVTVLKGQTGLTSSNSAVKGWQVMCVFNELSTCFTCLPAVTCHCWMDSKIDISYSGHVAHSKDEIWTNWNVSFFTGLVFFFYISYLSIAHQWWWGTAVAQWLRCWRSLFRSQMVSLIFFIDILPIALLPWGRLSL